MDTTKENDVSSNADQSMNISDGASNDSYESHSESNQFEGMEYQSSESETEESDPNADQGPDQPNNTSGDIRPVIGDNSGQARDETENIIDFDMLRSSLPAEPIVDTGFLTCSAKWELATTQAISANMKEVNIICGVINEQFRVKARPWQVSVVIDITKRRRDVCIIAGINAGKSLVYQSIPVFTGGSVLVISPTIALMEDQVCSAVGHLMRRYI